MIRITPESAMVIASGRRQFQASGGVEPYTWSVVPGMAGGAILPDGTYLAPANVTGLDHVIVTDSVGATAGADVAIEPVPLRIAPERKAMALSLTAPFSGIGGTPPYRFEKISGVGFIDPDTGVFTSEAETGTAKIHVIDAFNVTAEAEVSVGTPLHLLCDILEQELELPPGRVYLWDQKINQPKDKGLFIAVTALAPKAFGNSIRHLADDTGLNEVQAISMRQICSIDVISRDLSAYLRKEEILMALKSTYAEQQMEANSFFVSSLPLGFVNLSGEDGAAIPYRFNISCALHYSVTKLKAVPYFDTFAQASLTSVDP